MSSDVPVVVTPPAVIGIVGGGQLGRMLAQVAHRYGYRVAVLTGGGEQTPAGSVADFEIAASFDDTAAVYDFVARADVITWELEDVDLCVADVAAKFGVPVRPGPHVMVVAADRIMEKRAFIASGVPVTPYREVTTPSELVDAVAALNTSVIVKTARGGYDGKGQIRIGPRSGLQSDSTPVSVSELGEVFRGLGSDRLIVEQEVMFDREVSVVVTRAIDGTVVDYGVMENEHWNQILDTTITPAQLSSEIAEEAISIAARLAAHLDVIGVLCVEMFVVGSKLIVNEIAPRPHNSGHCTIEAAASSQFEQQLRSVCGLPLGDGSCKPAAMAQLLGQLWANGEPPWSEALTDPGIQLHLYGKREARTGRKMGHLTCVDVTPMLALERVLAARDRLRS